METRTATETRRDRAPHDWSGLEEWRELLRVQLAGHCRDTNELDDIVQETLLRAARNRRSLNSPDRFRPWLLRIAFNALRDLRRRARKLALVPLEEALDVAETEEVRDGEPVWVDGRRVPRSEALEHLSSAKRALREDDRALLDAFYGGAGAQGAALACGVDPKLVKVRLFRARGRLRKNVRQRVAASGRLERGSRC